MHKVLHSRLLIDIKSLSWLFFSSIRHCIFFKTSKLQMKHMVVFNFLMTLAYINLIKICRADSCLNIKTKLKEMLVCYYFKCTQHQTASLCQSSITNIFYSTVRGKGYMRDRGTAGAGPRDRGHGTEGSRVRVRGRSEEHTSELQSRQYLVCRLLLEKKKNKNNKNNKNKKKNKTERET